MENQIHSLDVLTPNTIYAGGSSYRCIPVRSHINVLPSIAERTSCENLPISHFASIFFIFSSTWKAQCWLPSVLPAFLLTTPFLVWFQFSMKLAWLLPFPKLSKVCCQIPQNVFEDKFTFLWEIKEHQLSRLAQENTGDLSLPITSIYSIWDGMENCQRKLVWNSNQIGRLWHYSHFLLGGTSSGVLIYKTFHRWYTCRL